VPCTACGGFTEVLWQMIRHAIVIRGLHHPSFSIKRGGGPATHFGPAANRCWWRGSRSVPRNFAHSAWLP
jgi:hypothetical protein